MVMNIKAIQIIKTRKNEGSYNMLGAVVGDVIDSVLLTMMKMVKRFLNRFENNETFTCAFLTSCYTGMRTGEVFALTWDILI